MRATGVQPKKGVTVLAELLQRQCSRLQPLAENQTGVQPKSQSVPQTHRPSRCHPHRPSRWRAQHSHRPSRHRLRPSRWYARHLPSGEMVVEMMMMMRAEKQTVVQPKKAVTPRVENQLVKMIPTVKVVPMHLTVKQQQTQA